MRAWSHSNYAQPDSANYRNLGDRILLAIFFNDQIFFLAGRGAENLVGGNYISSPTTMIC